jgi:hypothetical protein
MVIMKSSTFQNIKPHSPLKVSVSEKHIASIFRSEQQTKQETSMKLCCRLHASFLLGSLFDPNDGGDIFL